jgi:hypothetical protein
MFKFLSPDRKKQSKSELASLDAEDSNENAAASHAISPLALISSLEPLKRLSAREGEVMHGPLLSHTMI